MTTSLPETTQHLARLAQRLRSDPAYMASVLITYQSQERLSDTELTHRLAIDVDQLPRLALCKRPSSEGDKFAEQVRQIATYTGANPATLAQIIRQIEAVEKLHTLPPATRAEIEAQPLPSASGLMAAARDRQKEDDETSAEDETQDKDEDSS